MGRRICRKAVDLDASFAQPYDFPNPSLLLFLAPFELSLEDSFSSTLAVFVCSNPNRILLRQLELAEKGPRRTVGGYGGPLGGKVEPGKEICGIQK